MEAEGEGYRWPQDMERRRVAALRKFHLNNPNYKFMYEQLLGTSRDRIQGEKCGPSSVNPGLSAVTSKGRPRFENRWCLATTMELLEEMKAYVEAHKLHCLGEDMKKWEVIAIRLTNPRRLPLKRLARSSMVRFDNLRRYFRAGNVARIEVEVQDSLIDYFQICERQQSPRLKKPSPRPLSTVNLALNYRRASPSPQPTTATENPQQTAKNSRVIIHDSDDSVTSSADYSSDNSGDNLIGLSPALGNYPQPTSKDMKTLIRMFRSPPAAESGSIDQDDASKGYGAVPSVTRNKLRRTRLHKTSTSSP